MLNCAKKSFLQISFRIRLAFEKVMMPLLAITAVAATAVAHLAKTHYWDSPIPCIDKYPR